MFKPKIFTLFLMILFASLSSCNKDKNCELPKQIIGTGEIVSNAIVYQSSISWEMKDNDQIIQSDSQNVYALQVSFDNGLTYGNIDFSQYTLLGKFAREGCNVTFERNVSKDAAQKKCFYNITVLQCGKCETNWESMNWVLVPKIPEDYTVEFVVDYKKD